MAITGLDEVETEVQVVRCSDINASGTAKTNGSLHYLTQRAPNGGSYKMKEINNA